MSGAVCVGEHTLQSSDGKPVECAPYLCQGSACKTTCNSIVDCVAPTVCDAHHACIPLPYDTGTQVGCGCRAAGRNEASESVVLLAIAAAALARRRRVAVPTRGG